MRTLLPGVPGIVLAISLSACGGSSGNAVTDNAGQASAAPKQTTVTRPTVSLSAAAQLGQKIFFDKSLSGSGKMACATCHDPDHAYGPPNKLSVQLGGADLATPGTRAVPSLRYIQDTPPYADLLANPDGVSVPGPGGGYAWDGRADTLADQAAIPLLSPREMANASPADVVAKLRTASYVALFAAAFGQGALDDSDAAFRNALRSLQAFQLEDPSFHPYSSKFDLYAGNKLGGTMTAAEARGMKVFTDPNSGNCFSCHYQGAGLNGSSGLFTDFSYEAIGVPRNAAIAGSGDPSRFDMGLCGPERTDHLPPPAGAAERFCGLFKAPSLRNVATRTTFFHNGAMHTLEQVLRFYNTRDTRPELWYPTVGGIPRQKPDADFPTYGLVTTQYDGGTVQKFDDLPAAYRGNIDTQMPMDGRKPGSLDPMTEQQLADLNCFLKTLTDGYLPSAAAPTAGACVN